MNKHFSPFLFGCALAMCQAVAPNSEALSHSMSPDHFPQSSYIEDDIRFIVFFFHNVIDFEAYYHKMSLMNTI